MRLALVTVGNFIESSGGAEKVLCNMANEFVARGHEVGVFCFDRNVGRPNYYLRPEVTLRNLHKTTLATKCKCLYREIICSLSFNKENKKIRRAKLNNKIKSPIIVEGVKSFSPDIIISFQMEATGMLDSQELKGIPIVTMLHGNPAIYFDSETFPLYKKSIEKSEFVQVLMPEYVSEAREYVQTNIVYIPNVVPQYKYKAELTNKKIINVARLCPNQKRQHILIKAFSLINKKYPDWTVEIWGEGEDSYRNELEKLIIKKGLSKQVFLCGVSDKIYQKILKASIFAFPSSYEGFPLALTEAMSLGVPAIGIDSCPSVNKLIVNDVNGILVSDNVEEFSQAMIRLMDSYDQRKKMGKKAKDDMKRFSDVNVWNKWELELFKALEG